MSDRGWGVAVADRLLVDLTADGLVSVWQTLGDEVPSPVAQPTPLEYPLATDELEDLRWYVEDYLRAPFGVYEQRGTEIAGQLPEWGRRLFAAVFGSGPARDAYIGMRNRAQACSGASGEQPEILFRSPSAAWLGLPWELARDAADSSPIALAGMEIVRSLPAGMDPAFQVLGERLRVLMVISRPRGAGDVGFRMIARPLLDRLRSVPGPVDLVVLRPPTLQALVETLREARAAGEPFQVVHFDGHGALAGRPAGGSAPLAYAAPAEQGVLVFEATGGGPDPVPAEQVAQALAEAQVPVVVLNACQSGAIGRDLEATVAARLLAAGASSVVAMAYSVYAVAAAEFMTGFYDRLFAGESVGAAVTAGRARLARNQLRPSPKGKLPLADWLVPVHYLRRAARFPQLRPSTSSRGEVAVDDFRDRSPSGRFVAREQADPWAARDPFVGRDGLFYDLEVAARLQKVVLLHGPGGTGKTELARAFGRWWRETGGVDNPNWVVWHLFQPGIGSFGLDGVLSTIGLQAFGTDFAKVPPRERRSVIVRLLAERRLLVVWDNFESVHSMPDPTSATPSLDEASRGELLDFLTDAASGQSAILITSRSPEPWLGELRRIPVGGLSTEEASEYADQLLAPYPSAAEKRNQRAFGELIQWLGGHPLSMRVTLPQLDTTAPATLLKRLQGLTPLPDEEHTNTGDRATSLPACITYSITHLDAATRRRLLAVSLFFGIADVNVLGAFSQHPQAPTHFRNLTAQDWDDALTKASAVGLLTPLGALYAIHPALPAYLTAQWHADDPDGYQEQRDRATTALLDAYAAFSEWLDQQIVSGDAALALALIDRQRATLGHLLGHAIDTGQWTQALTIAQPLDRYWNVRGMLSEADAWVDRVRLALEDAEGTPPPLESAAGSLWGLFVTQQAIRQVDAGELDTAERTYRIFIEMITAQPDSAQKSRRLAGAHQELAIVARLTERLEEAEDQYRTSLAAFESLGDLSAMASVYHELGVVAALQQRVEEAEDWHRKALDLNRRLGNQRGMADGYHELGRTAGLRNRLDEAENLHRRGLTVSKQLGDRPGMATGYHALGIVAHSRGRLDEAEDLYRQALTLREQVGYRAGMAQTYGQLGLLAELRGHPEQALEWMVRCVALFDRFPHPFTAPGPHHLARLTATFGVEALQTCWRKVTGHTPPPEVMDFVESYGQPEE